MKKHEGRGYCGYIEAWQGAEAVAMRESEGCISHVCTNDLVCGEAAEAKREEVSRIVHDMLYRQAVRQAQHSRNVRNPFNIQSPQRVIDEIDKIKI